jgi:hypothetical protein
VLQICEDGSVQIKIIKRAGRSEVRDVISYRFNTRKNLSSILFVCQHRDKSRLWTERRGSDVTRLWVLTAPCPHRGLRFTLLSFIPGQIIIISDMIDELKQCFF